MLKSNWIKAFQKRPDLLPSLGIVIGAGMWGLFWLPVRSLGELGIAPTWTGPVIFSAVLITLGPFAIWRLRHFRAAGWNIVTGGLLAGLAFTLYTISFNLTEIVRVLLLFYMTPVWSTVLGILLLGESLRLNRICAMLLGFCGLVVVLGTETGIPWPRGSGDWLALAAGMVWSVASVQLLRGGASYIFEKTTVFVFFSLVTAVLIAFLPLGIQNNLPSLDTIGRAIPILVLVGLLVAPGVFLTIWPASVLSPARVGILFMFEVVVGIASAALLTDEPFGRREILGAALIVSAGLVEVLPLSGNDKSAENGGS